MTARTIRNALWGAALLALVPLLLPRVLPAATPDPGEAPPVGMEIPKDPFAGLTERFRAMAKRDEQSKDWHRALMRWEAIAAMEPRDRESRTRISAIRKLLKSNGDRHFAMARKALQDKQYAKAFREFLRTLSYDPDNHLALTMVKHELNAKSINEYKVKRGDTLREIAVSEYDDPELTYLVQHYNGIRDPRDLKVGQVLKLPVIAGVLPTRAQQVAAAKPAPKRPAPRKPAATAKAERPKAPPPPAAKAPAPAKPEEAPKAEPQPEAKPEPEAPAPAEEAVAAQAAEAPVSAGAAIVAAEVRQEPQAEASYAPAPAPDRFDEAQSLYEAGKYDEAAAAAETVLEEDPANSRARGLINAAYYEQGKRLRDRQQYLAAMQVLTRVDPKYKDTGDIISGLKNQVGDQQAEAHYIAGVTAFLEEDLDTAISEWEQTLQLDPNHAQAAKDLENAKSLRAKLAQVQ